MGDGGWVQTGPGGHPHEQYAQRGGQAKPVLGPRPGLVF